MENTVKVVINGIEYEINKSEVQSFLSTASFLSHDIEGWFKCDTCDRWFQEDQIGSNEEGIMCKACTDVLMAQLREKQEWFDKPMEERLDEVKSFNEDLMAHIENMVASLRERDSLWVIYVGVTGFADEGEGYSDGVYLAGSKFHPLLATPLEGGESGGIDLFWDWVRSQLDNNLAIDFNKVTLDELDETWITSDGFDDIEEFQSNVYDMLEALVCELGSRPEDKLLDELGSRGYKHIELPVEAANELRDLVNMHIDILKGMVEEPSIFDSEEDHKDSVDELAMWRRIVDQI